MQVFLETSSKTSAEYSFFSYMLNEVLHITNNIICVGGKDNLKNFINQFETQTLKGERNVVIFDADTKNNGGGFAKRNEELLKFRQDNNLNFDLFLMPNNQDDGDFETILLGSVKKEHKHILLCFNKFQECINMNNNNNYPYHFPNSKSKIYTYKELLQGSTNAQKWHFENADYWDFNNKYIDSLKKFLLFGVPNL